MARETKVALVAGLSFIILFAVILTNRGRREPVLGIGAARPGLGPLTVEIPPDSSTVPASGINRTPPADRSAVSTLASSTAAPAEQGERGPAAGGPAHMASGADAIGQLPGLATLIDPQSSPQSAGQVPAGSAMAPTAAAAGQAVSEAQRRELQALLDRTGQASPPGRSGGSAGAVTDGRPAPPTDARLASGAQVPAGTSAAGANQPMAIGAGDGGRPVEYVVEKGDTLYRIAARFYGSGSREVVGAIHDANRATMPTPDHLVVGQKIMLPNLASAPPKAPAAASTATPKSAPPAAKTGRGKPEAKRDKAEPPFRWYQVRKDDRYVSIAREQLGDAGRWREVYELNKDKFPEPDRIREGVRIKLPAVTLASAGE